MSTTAKQNGIYYVDPGIGKKISGCPYTNHKDGRDILSFIRPPKGYELTGFKFEPYPETNAFYDGRIIAQYEKANFVALFRNNPWKYLAFFFIIGGVIAGAIFFISRLKPTTEPFLNPNTEIATTSIDTTNQEQANDTITLAESIINEDPVEKAVVMEEIITETEEVVEEVQPIEDAVEYNTKEKEKEIVQPSVAEAKPAQVSQTVETLTEEQFHQELWDLIHNKESHMSTYHNLYNKYKRLNLKNTEFFYLYLTILENTKAFGKWRDKLVRIPVSELKSIHTINALKEKLEKV